MKGEYEVPYSEYKQLRQGIQILIAVTNKKMRYLFFSDEKKKFFFN